MVFAQVATSLDSLTPTIFHQPWWLSTVSGGRYEEAQVFTGRRLVGRLPYVTSRKFGMTLVQMPMLTHFLGPVVEDGEGNGPSSFLNRLSIAKSLIRQLPRASHVYIKHHRYVTDTIAFQAADYLSDVQFTCELEPAEKDVLWRGMRDKTRNVIRRAKERFEIVEMSESRRFTDLYDRNLTERRLCNYYDAAIAAAIIDESVKRGVGRLLAANDREGETKAAIFTVWDENAEYYLMTTRSQTAGNGVVSLLLWHAIKHASARNVVFDFDGIQGLGDARFFAGFGAIAKPRLISYLNSRAYKMLDRFGRR